MEKFRWDAEHVEVLLATELKARITRRGPRAVVADFSRNVFPATTRAYATEALARGGFRAFPLPGRRLQVNL
jgi:hypothetical protein